LIALDGMRCWGLIAQKMARVEIDCLDGESAKNLIALDGMSDKREMASKIAKNLIALDGVSDKRETVSEIV
jgi:hypothetical protein